MSAETDSTHTTGEHVLRSHDFRAFFVGQTLSAIGDSLIPLALAFAVLDLTTSAGTLGLVLLASRGPMILFMLVGGAVGDKYSRRTVMVIADLARFIVQAAAAAMLVANVASPWSLAVLAMVAGVGSAFFQPAATGILPTIVPERSIQEANSLLGVSRSVARIAGIAISGILVAWIGPGWAFLIDAISFALSATAIAAIRSGPSNEQVAGRPALVELMRGGISEVATRTWLWVSIVNIALMNLLVIAPFLVLGPYIADRDLGGPASWAKLGVAAAIGGLIGNAVATRWKPRYPLVVIYLGTLLVVPLLVLLAMPGSLWLLAPAATIGLAQNSFFNVVHTTILQTRIPQQVLATVSSISMTGTLVAVPLGLAGAGPIAEATNTGTVLVAGSIWVVLSATVMATLPSSRTTPSMDACRQ